MATVFITLLRSPVLVRGWRTLGLLLVCLLPVLGQKYEIAPFIGARSGGTLKVADEAQQNRAEAGVKNSASFGVAGGFRFAGDSFDQCDDCSYIGFRWIRQKTNLKLEKVPATINPLASGGIGRPDITLDHFLGDFSYDWILEDAKMVRPFLTASLGAARMSAPAGASTKFAFGLGGGVKVFPHRRWGIRFQAEWLPIVTHATVENLVCVGACMIRLGGGLMNQFEVSIGPILRF